MKLPHGCYPDLPWPPPLRDYAAERERERRKSEAVRLAVVGLREHEIGRTGARHELESDEHSTARVKALAIIGGVR